MSRVIGDRALVVGGSMAGLLAARVLADSYDQVTVIDRDDLPEASTHRRGVPRSPHPCTGGARAASLEEPFPGITQELVADGAPAGDMLTDARFNLSGHRLRQASTRLTPLCASRPFLEAHVRARVRALPHLRFLDRRELVGLTTSPDGRRVTGARAFDLQARRPPTRLGGGSGLSVWTRGGGL